MKVINTYVGYHNGIFSSSYCEILECENGSWYRKDFITHSTMISIIPYERAQELINNALSKTTSK